MIIMLSNKEKDVIENYLFDNYVNIIRYILSFDTSKDNTYTINLEYNECDNNMCNLSFEVLSSKIGNANGNFSLSEGFNVYLPKDLTINLINKIKEHFTDKHLIIYSSFNRYRHIQTIQNEKFTFYTKLNNEEEEKAAAEFNRHINDGVKHETNEVLLDKEDIEKYFVNNYINTIRYILTFSSENSKYSVNISNKKCNNDTSLLEMSISPNVIGNVNNEPLIIKQFRAYLPSSLADNIVNSIRNHFEENHYIVYSSFNKISHIQTLQNEKFTVCIVLNKDDEIAKSIDFNNKVNSTERHPTKVLKMI